MQFQTTANLNVRSGPGVEFEILDTLEKGDVVEEVEAAGWLPVLMDDGSVGWIATKYLAVEVISSLPAPAPPVANPIWIQWARKQLGQKEVPGVANNPVIQAWYRLTTLPSNLWIDSTAWCAVFVNAALMLNNIKGLRSADAEAWKKFGTEADPPQLGDIVVFEWDSGQHHVAFFLRDLGNGEIQVIGGNQSDAVTIEDYPADNVLAYRRVGV